ncbi:MAG: hypothetical protein AABY14_04130 [Nanoarchaeota archaeon]
MIQPWIIALWRKFLLSPKIEIYPSGNIEIGYSEYGPTIGLHGTLRAQNGDIFVKRARIRIKRDQTNEEHWFAWVAFRSPAIRFNPTDNPPMELPSGFIVSHTQPHRYNIVFHDHVIQNEIRSLLEKLNQAAINIAQEKMLSFARDSATWPTIYKGAHDEYSKTTEFRDAFDRLDRHCYWQSGKYSLDIHIDTNKGDSKFIKQLAFKLTEEEVRRLRLNRVIMIENPLRAMAKEQLWKYNFVYPVFEELKAD